MEVIAHEMLRVALEKYIKLHGTKLSFIARGIELSDDMLRLFLKGTKRLSIKSLQRLNDYLAERQGV